MKLNFFLAGFAAIASARGTLRDPNSFHGAVSNQKRPTYIYVDHWENSLEHTDFIKYVKDLVNAGASHILLAFVVPGAGDALDSTGQYDRLTDAERAELKTFMSANNAKLIMSIGGGNYGNTFVRSDATVTATKWCGYAADKGYDGVDWDLEGFTARTKDHPEMEWIKTAADVCHKYISLVSHAPQAPNIGLFSNYAFEGVIEASTDPTDRFLIQYYNQPTAPYTNFASIFQSDREFLASMAEIEKRVPSAKGKLVLGKYMYGFGGTGELSADALVSILEQAEASGYTGGVMVWKAPAKGTAQLSQFLKTDLPKLAGLGSAPTPTKAPAPAPTKVPAPLTTRPTVAPHVPSVPTRPTVAPRPSTAPRTTKPIITTKHTVPSTKAPRPSTAPRITKPIITTKHTVPPTKAPSMPTPVPSAAVNSKVPCVGAKTYDGSVFMTNDHVVYENALWRANWYAQNPPSETDLAWTKLGDCDAPLSIPPCVAEEWDATKIYATPSDVTYQSGTYRNKWYSRAGAVPSRTDENWVFLGECSASAI